MPRLRTRLNLCTNTLLAILLVMVTMQAPVTAFGLDSAPIATGTVTDAGSGLPVAGAQIYAEYYDPLFDEWYPAGNAVTAGDGTYTVTDEFAYGAGTYTIYVSAAGYVQQDDVDTWNGTDALDFDFALTEAAIIAGGTVTDKVTTDPVENAQVTAQFWDSSGNVWRPTGFAYTAADGTYTVSDDQGYGAGTYRVYVGAAGFVPEDTGNLTWDGSTTLVKDFDLEYTLTIASGSVTATGSGDPIANAFIWAEFYDSYAEDWEYAYDTTTTAAGAYAITDIFERGPGDYRLNVVAGGYVYQSRVETWNGTDSLAVDFVLEPAAPLATGSVTDTETLDPVEGASIEVEFYDVDNVRWVDAGDAVSAPDGDYSVSDDYNHGAGDYRFSISASGYVGQEVTRKWDGAAPLVVDFALEPVHAPVANDDSYETDEDVALVVPAPGVLTNDTDVDGDPLTAVKVTNPSHGTVTLSTTGAFTYTPNADWFGQDGFTYKAFDGTAYSMPATVDITVNAVDDPDPEDPDPEDPPVAEVVRVAGTDRYRTAIEASSRAYPDGAKTVVIATGTNWPDALGGSALAGVVDGPLLLTKTDTLPPAVLAEVERLGATDAYILGGTVAVSSVVENTLRSNLSRVTRLAGASRYSTANLVAAEVIKLQGGAYSGKAFIATGENFPDALGASPVAASSGTPILLVAMNGTPYLPSKVTEATILGGTAAVSATTEAAARTALGASKVVRVGGTDRYDTAARIADVAVAGGMHWDGVGVATGVEFPDAMSGGAMLGSFDTVLLLTKPTTLSSSAEQRLKANKAAIGTVHIIGGTSAVSDTVRDRVVAVLR